MSTESQNRDQGSWEPCPTGELQQLAGRLSAQRRHRQLTKAGQWAAGATLSVALVLMGSFVVGQFSQGPFGGIACGDVVPQLVAYRAGELDAKLAGQISDHLDKCPHCGPKYRNITTEPVDPAEAEHAPVSRPPILAVLTALTPMLAP